MISGDFSTLFISCKNTDFPIKWSIKYNLGEPVKL